MYCVTYRLKKIITIIIIVAMAPIIYFCTDSMSSFVFYYSLMSACACLSYFLTKYEITETMLVIGDLKITWESIDVLEEKEFLIIKTVSLSTNGRKIEVPLWAIENGDQFFLKIKDHFNSPLVSRKRNRMEIFRVNLRHLLVLMTFFMAVALGFDLLELEPALLVFLLFYLVHFMFVLDISNEKITIQTSRESFLQFKKQIFKIDEHTSVTISKKLGLAFINLTNKNRSLILPAFIFNDSNLLIESFEKLKKD